MGSFPQLSLSRESDNGSFPCPTFTTRRRSEASLSVAPHFHLPIPNNTLKVILEGGLTQGHPRVEDALGRGLPRRHFLPSKFAVYFLDCSPPGDQQSGHILITSFPLRRFSQTFIDIREKEKKRGARGLNGRMQNDAAATITATGALDVSSPTTTEAATVATPSKDLLELQEKITKEILSSKLHLQEDEMKELQVSIVPGGR